MGEIEKKCRELLVHYSILGLDTMLFIYHFEENKDYLPFTRALFGLIEDGMIEGKTSIITRLEIRRYSSGRIQTYTGEFPPP